MTWAWPAGKPKHAPWMGTLYSDNSTEGATNGMYLAESGTAFSYQFSKCPDYARCHGWDELGNMSFAYMQVHDRGDLSAAENIGDVVPGFVPAAKGRNYSG